MEFNFNVNHLFPETISVVTAQTTLPHRHDGRQLLKELEQIIDTIGAKSAHAQKLSGPITSWVKLRINNHKIYILKEAEANNGNGSIIGFLKIGQKQLFVLDREGNHNELRPLCVLDFYVHESQQRKGQGLKLFKKMLESEGVVPAHLAVDRPSSKFTSFLRKHFNLWATLPQVNNFVVFEGFFKNRKDAKRSNTRNGERNEGYADFRPLSRAVSDDRIRKNRQGKYSFNESYNRVRPMSGSSLSGPGDYQQFSQYNRSGQGARANMYSRFATDTNSPQVPSLPSRRKGNRSQDEIITNPYRRVTNKFSSSSSPEDMRDILGDLKENDEATMAGGGNFANRHIEHHQRSFVKMSCVDVETHAAIHCNDMESSSQTNTMEPTHLNHGQMLQESKDENSEPEQSNHFLASKNIDKYSNSYNKRYESPADMILELQHKDREEKDPASLRRRQRSHYMYGTSWNIFGVPTQARWKKYQS